MGASTIHPGTSHLPSVWCPPRFLSLQKSTYLEVCRVCAGCALAFPVVLCLNLLSHSGLHEHPLLLADHALIILAAKEFELRTLYHCSRPRWHLGTSKPSQEVGLCIHRSM
jgi:hypothetical protein